MGHKDLVSAREAQMMIYLQPIINTSHTTVTKKEHEWIHWIGPRGVDDILLDRTPVPNIHPAAVGLVDRRYCRRDFT